MLLLYKVYNLDYFLLLLYISKLSFSLRKVFVYAFAVSLHITFSQTSCFDIRQTVAMIDKFWLTYYFIL